MKKISLVLVLVMLIGCFAGCVNDKDEHSEKETTYAYIVDGGSSEYSVVMGDKATSEVKSLATDLVGHIEKLTSAKLDRITDNASKYPVLAKEIIIGVNDREESKALFSELSETGWKIKYTDSKLVIVASNDYMLSLAYNALTEKYLIKDEKGLKIDDKLDVSYSGVDDMVSLLDDEGKFKYTVVFSANATSEVRSAVSNLTDMLKYALGINSVPVTTDKNADNGGFEILVGETNRSASKALYDGIDVLEMKSAVEGNKIVIGSGLNNSIGNAVSSFVSYVINLSRGTYDGKYMLAKNYSDTKTSIDYLEGIPVIKAGTLIGSDDCGDGTHVLVWDNVKEADYNAYKNELEAAGMVLSNTYEMGNNKHALYKGDKANVYASYIGSENIARVFYEKAGTLYPSAEEQSYETVSEYIPTLWMLDVDSQKSSSDAASGSNGGMSFILKVADGSFIIIDGGYNTAKESSRILDFLKENTPEGQTPVVSAWIITHQHSDHYGALRSMTAKHLNDITVKAFYYNMPSEGHDAADGMANSIRGWMSKWKGAVQYSKLHSGMRFYVADAQIDVIFTHEDLYPVTGTNLNDTSLVLRVTHGGKRIMFLADIEERASRVIEKYMTKEEMKSDFVQVAHHGYEGATRAIYDMIEAHTVLWPVNTFSFQSSSYGKNIFKLMINGGWSAVNKYLANDATYVKTVICAEEAHWGAFKIELPDYTPRDNRLPDYDELYNRVKAEFEETAGGEQ